MAHGSPLLTKCHCQVTEPRIMHGKPCAGDTRRKNLYGLCPVTQDTSGAMVSPYGRNVHAARHTPACGERRGSCRSIDARYARGRHCRAGGHHQTGHRRHPPIVGRCRETPHQPGQRDSERQGVSGPQQRDRARPAGGGRLQPEEQPVPALPDGRAGPGEVRPEPVGSLLGAVVAHLGGPVGDPGQRGQPGRCLHRGARLAGRGQQGVRRLLRHLPGPQRADCTGA